MAQNVIASRDVDIYLELPNIISVKLVTASNFTRNISGNTEDIGAISTDSPIATDNGGDTFDVSFTFQKAEAIDFKNALATATAGEEGGSYAHIRQIIEGATITSVYHKKRDVPPTITTETFFSCTGVEEQESIDRRTSETLVTWSWRARGMTHSTVAG